jgi:hypothetical protein
VNRSQKLELIGSDRLPWHPEGLLFAPQSGIADIGSAAGMVAGTSASGLLWAHPKQTKENSISHRSTDRAVAEKRRWKHDPQGAINSRRVKNTWNPDSIMLYHPPMDRQLIIICALTAGINFIGTLAYAARIAGARTGRIAMSFALFNILVLVRRTSNSFLGPFLAKRIESRIVNGGGHHSRMIFE